MPLTITPDDARDHYWVEVTITPRSSQDDMLRAQLAQGFRAPGPSGTPLLSDRDIHEQILRTDRPEEATARAWAQIFEATDPEIADIRKTVLRERWKKDNREMLREYEKALNPDPLKSFEKLKKTLTPEKFQMLIKMGAMMEHAEMMGDRKST